MSKECSLSKIIKNKIGFYNIGIFVVSIICFIIAMVFIKNMYIKVSLIIVSTIVILIMPIYSIIEIIKIKYFFRNGIETKAVVKDNVYIGIGHGNFSFMEYGKDLERSNDMYAYKNKWGRREYAKNGTLYEYKINGEIYNSSSNYIINGDTMFIKQGSIITILANTKNKNETIIKDIYIRTNGI